MYHDRFEGKNGVGGEVGAWGDGKGGGGACRKSNAGRYCHCICCDIITGLEICTWLRHCASHWSTCLQQFSKRVKLLRCHCQAQNSANKQRSRLLHSGTNAQCAVQPALLVVAVCISSCQGQHVS